MEIDGGINLPYIDILCSIGDWKVNVKDSNAESYISAII